MKKRKAASTEIVLQQQPGSLSRSNRSPGSILKHARQSISPLDKVSKQVGFASREVIIADPEDGDPFLKGFQAQLIGALKPASEKKKAKRWVMQSGAIQDKE